MGVMGTIILAPGADRSGRFSGHHVSGALSTALAQFFIYPISLVVGSLFLC